MPSFMYANGSFLAPNGGKGNSFKSADGSFYRSVVPGAAVGRAHSFEYSNGSFFAYGVFDVPGATLDLSFMTPGMLDPRITFTRASTATYFDSTGTMRTTGYNFLVFSQDITNFNWQKSGTVTVTGTVVAPDGTMTGQTINVGAPGAGAFFQAVTGLTNGTRYEPSFWINRISTTGTLNVQNEINGANGAWQVNIALLSPGWQRITRNHPAVTITAEFTATSGQAGPFISAQSGTINASWWGFQLELGTVSTSYIPTTSSSSGAPRWDYNPSTHALNGLLIEEARTNLAFPSSNFTPAWAWVAVNVTPGQAGAPDGTATVARVAETATSAAFYVAQNPTLLGSTAYTVSVHGKAAQNRYLQIALDDSTANGAFATFDLQTGTISGVLTKYGNSVIGTASIQPVGNGFYRCSITTTIGTVGASGRMMFILSNVPAPGFAPGYAGNPANGLLLWGAQLEQGTFATSYIPTTAASVTRAADSCSISVANMSPWFVPPGGSWMMEFINFIPSPPNSRVIGNTGTGGGITPLFLPSSLVVGQYDATTAVQTANSIVVNAISKAASTWAVGQAKMCANGGAVATSATLTSGYTGLAAGGVTFMGNLPSATDNTSGYIRRVRYWPRALSNAELQSVTT
jgi:hypothetical protein